MTTPRFIALMGGAALSSRAQVDRLAEAAMRLSFEPVFRQAGLIVLANPAATVTPLVGRPGVAIGTIFQRNETTQGPYNKAATVEVSEQAGDDLARSYWGAYVAFIVNRPHQVLQVLRDPSGSFSCYLSRKDDVDIVYSHVDTAYALGLIRGEPDPAAVAHHLTYPGLRVERTALVGVEEVLPGTSVSLNGAGAITRRRHWTPWTFATKANQISDRRDAIEQVHTETQRCVSTWADQYPSILHELSGGLDSSIVAACLAGRTDPVTCITFVTPDPGADERAYAQQVADGIGAPLRTLMLELADSDLKGLAEPMTARPGSGMLHQVLDRALTREAERAGAPVLFSGGGGDNVFCYLNTAAPAADALRRHGLGPVFWHSVADLAALHGCTTWRAGQLALRKALRPLRSWPRDVDFLTSDAPPRAPDPHTWLDAPRGALHGQHEHIISLMAVQNPLNCQASHGPALVCYPLLSQPLVELCLRIPSCMWITGGRNRAIARDAFTGRLPPAILQRRTKGDFMGMLGALYEKHRPELADLLLGGWLAHQSLLDRKAMETYLNSAAPVTDFRFHRLMELANVEVWARSWLERSPPALPG